MRCHRGLIWLMAATLAAPALAQDGPYPDRPIRIVVPFPPGGANDTVTRIVAERLSARFGQPVVVENKPGAAGNIGAEMVAHAKPDGYTLLAAPPPPLVINHSLYPKLGYDPTRFVPITVMAAAPNVLVVHPRVAANSAPEFIALARAATRAFELCVDRQRRHAALDVRVVQIGREHPDHARALQGRASLPRGAERRGRCDVHEPVRRAAARARRQAQGAGGGQRARNRGAARRAAARGNAAGLRVAHLVRRGRRRPARRLLADKLAAAMADALKEPDTARKLADLHLQPVGESPARTAAFFNEEAERWRKVIRAADIKPD